MRSRTAVELIAKRHLLAVLAVRSNFLRPPVGAGRRKPCLIDELRHEAAELAGEAIVRTACLELRDLRQWIHHRRRSQNEASWLMSVSAKDSERPELHQLVRQYPGRSVPVAEAAAALPAARPA